MYQQEEIRRVQKHLLDILKEIIKVCDELGIEYFLMGGAALGAVRHGGFIPWDDDLDIGMTRENYNLFLKKAPKYLRKDLFLQTYHTEPKSPFYFAKVRKANTEFVEYYCRDMDIHSGIYVDIFPYDSVPDNEKERKSYYKSAKRWLNLYIAKEVTGTSTTYTGFKKMIYGCIRNILHIVTKPIPKKYLYYNLDKRLQRYNQQPTTYLGYGGLPKIQVRRKNIEQYGWIDFEGIRIKCPYNLEEYLEDNYGNYMQLPPEDERKGHAPYRLKV